MLGRSRVRWSAGSTETPVFKKTFVYDHTAKLPANVTGTFLLKGGERITDSVRRRNNDHVHNVTVESRKTIFGKRVPRALWDVGNGSVDVREVIEMEGCQFLMEISTKTVDEDKTEGRKYAKLMGDLLSLEKNGKPTTLTDNLRANRIVIRPFVTIKKPLPVEAKVRVQFKYTIASKNMPKQTDTPASAASS